MAEYYAQSVEYPTPPPQPDGRVEPRPEGVPMHAHEGTDVAIRPLVYIGVGLVVFLIATCVFLVFLHDLFKTMEQKGVTNVTGVTVERASGAPADVPPLQGVPGYHKNIPAEDMNEFRRENQRVLTTYSTANDGLARIPVVDAKTGRGGVAMDLALQRKLFKISATGPTTAPVDTGAVPGARSPAQAEQLEGRRRQSSDSAAPQEEKKKD